MRVMKSARREYASVIASLCIAQALRSRLPPAKDFNIVPGDHVHVFREVSTQFHGPFELIRVSDKEIYVNCEIKE